MRIFCASLLLLSASGCSANFSTNRSGIPVSQIQLPETLSEETSVKPGQNLAGLAAGWEVPAAPQFVNTARAANHLRLRAGEKIRVHRTLGPVTLLTAVEFPINDRTSLFLRWNQHQWSSEQTTRNYTERTRQFAGRLDSTLWASAAKAGMDTQLLVRLSEVFAWVIDFSREIKVGDEWRLVATEYVDGEKHLAWKEIRLAEFRRGPHVYQAFNYEDTETKRRGFFNSNGESLEKLFLKSPIKFARISSRFAKRRFHPILQINRPHLGVDYAAPVGTPIMAVGDGVVQFAAFSGGGGRIIKIKHNGTFTTAYKHLSRFATGMKVGQRIHQGDIVGYVGMTGLSTGPHLHFEFLKNGTFVDPQGLSFPAAVPLKPTEKVRFEQSARGLASLLPNWPAENAGHLALRDLSSVNQ